ncbi:MAG: DUF2169 domain-containing protein [Fibrobacterales bacterium]
MFTRIIPGTSPDGTPILSVLGKETFNFEHGLIAQIDKESPIPFHDSDEYYGDNPITDPIKHESDLVAFKPATDVLFKGKAIAPNGKRAKYFDLAVGIGNFIKQIRVFGNRKVNKTPFGFEFTEPELFDEMPIHSGLAYGGIDDKSDEGVQYTYQKNPAGKGFVVKEKADSLHDLELPNLEDPYNLLTPEKLILKDYNNWKKAPDPVGLGPVAKNSYPRYLHAGLPMEQHIANEAARKEQLANGADPQSLGDPTPLINPLFYNSAQTGMRLPYLKGDETIRMMYMDAEHPKFECKLPGITMKAWLNVGTGLQIMDTVIQTVEIHKETNQLTLVWRASSFYEGVESMKNFSEFKFGMEVFNGR